MNFLKKNKKKSTSKNPIPHGRDVMPSLRLETTAEPESPDQEPPFGMPSNLSKRAGKRPSSSHSSGRDSHARHTSSPDTGGYRPGPVGGSGVPHSSPTPVNLSDDQMRDIHNFDFSQFITHGSGSLGGHVSGSGSGGLDSAAEDDSHAEDDAEESDSEENEDLEDDIPAGDIERRTMLQGRMLIKPVEPTSFDPDLSREFGSIFQVDYPGPYITWSEVPYETKNTWWQVFQGRYRWKTKYNKQIESCFNKKCQKKIRSTFYDYRIKKSPKWPYWVGKEYKAEMERKWREDETFKKRSAINKLNVKAPKSNRPPVGHWGSKSANEHRKSLRKDAGGRDPSAMTMYVHGKTPKRGPNAGIPPPEVQAAADKITSAANMLLDNPMYANTPLETREMMVWQKVLPSHSHEYRYHGLGSAGEVMSQTYTQSSHSASSSYQGGPPPSSEIPPWVEQMQQEQRQIVEEQRKLIEEQAAMLKRNQEHLESFMRKYGGGAP